MKTFHFGIRVGNLPAAMVAVLREIAAGEGVEFWYSDVPGLGLRSWFAKPVEGDEIDKAAALAVLAQVRVLAPSYIREEGAKS